jgi:predicted GNAT family N-acyltransferase
MANGSVEGIVMNVNVPIHGQTVAVKASRDLDRMDVERVARGLVAFSPSVESIGPLLQRAGLQIPGLASPETVLRVYAHNPDCLFAFARTDNLLDGLREPEGFIGQLPLNGEGRRALFSGELATADPDTRFLCRQYECPEAIYIWGIFINPKVAGGIALVMERLSSSKYRHAPLYCKATSEKSWNFFLTLGFQPGVIWQGHLLPELLEYRRLDAEQTPMLPPSPAANIDRPPYDMIGDLPDRLPHDRQSRVTIVHCMDDLVKVFAVRAATYVAEQDCPYDEEFDGNDFSATHLLGFVGREPAGCLRIRYFADFAKLERLAVVRRFRQTRLAFKLIEAGISFCQAKGYRKLYGHAEPRVCKLWERFGFRPRTTSPTLAFSNLEFVVGDLELPLDPKALADTSDPYVLIRPEGQWARPGVLDASANKRKEAEELERQ